MIDLRQGDCLEVLKDIHDESAITTPCGDIVTKYDDFITSII